MNTRPIHTLAEDFAYLGLVDEMDQPEGAQQTPDAKSTAMQKKLIKAKSQMAGLQKKALKMGMPQEEIEEALANITDEDLENIPDDVEMLDEFKIMKFFKNLLKKGKKKPSRAERQQKAREQKLYRKGRGASVEKRREKGSRFKKLKKLYAKAKAMGKKAVHGARRMFAQMLGGGGPKKESYDLDSLGSIITALEHTDDSRHFSAQYADIAELSTEVAKEFRHLDEHYVDIHYPLGEAASYCELIAEEAREFLGALRERDGKISVEDQRILSSHLTELKHECLAMANYWDDTEILIALDEGRFPTVATEDEDSFWLLRDDDQGHISEDDDEEEDDFEGIRGQVALMFGIHRR